MQKFLQHTSLCLAILLQASVVAAQIVEWDVGLSSKRTIIRAQGVQARTQAAPTILYLAGLTGENESSDRLRSILNTYSQLDAVETLIHDYLAGEPIAVANASVVAGHLVFAEYAERTGDKSALEIATAAAELAFDEQGNMREAVPMHNQMSDSFFMATPLLTKVGKLSGEAKYFDMAARHVEFLRDLLLREDGLYRHSPLANVAWSRGNAFPALGLALSLSDFPQTHRAYLALIDVLRSFQDADGMWHEVIDYPGSFSELSSTAMIGIALKRGIDRGWLSAETYQPILDRAWNAILIRTSLNGEFIDVCTSTGKLQSLDAYLDRQAILGRDDRAAGMVMNFANEMAGYK